MSKNYENELIVFQDSVLKEYEFLKLIEESDSQMFKDSSEEHIDSSKKENIIRKIFRLGFSKIMDSLIHRALQHHSQSDDYKKYFGVAKEIIFDPSIKFELCEKFDKEFLTNLLSKEKEIKLIKIVTSVLMIKQYDKKYSLPLDAKLLAYIVYEILQIGIESYCKDEVLTNDSQ